MRLLFSANTVTAADEARTNTYGAVKEIPAKLNAAFPRTPAMLRKSRSLFLRIIETPPQAEKQLRYFVSPQDLAVDKINAL